MQKEIIGSENSGYKKRNKNRKHIEAMKKQFRKRDIYNCNHTNHYC